MAGDYLGDLLGLPPSLIFALESLFAEQPDCADNALDSLALFSLFKGLYLPLSGMTPAIVAQRFGIRYSESGLSNRELVQNFFAKGLGLSISEKIAYLLGDPFFGKPAGIGQDTLLTVLAGIRLIGIAELRERLAPNCRCRLVIQRGGNAQTIRFRDYQSRGIDYFTPVVAARQ